MTWYYNDVPLLEEMIEADWIGFVYLIENLLTGRKYLGKKGFYRSKTYQKNNRKRRKSVQSDWQKYYGSSEELKEEIRNNGRENFKRTILHICKSKSEMN